MPRNLSESQLLQIGSKAVSNVAGQFFKFGQTLNPVKNRAMTSKKSRNNSNPQIVYNPSTANPLDIASAMIDKDVQFSVGKKVKGSESDSDSDENDCSIYEPDVSDLVQENPIYNENTFLPSVGIVMSSNDSNASSVQQHQSHIKMSEDVSTMSISSVTDFINMPAGMLENAMLPMRPVSPAPEIRIHGSDTEHNLERNSAQTFSHSSNEVNSPVSSSLNR